MRLVMTHQRRERAKLGIFVTLGALCAVSLSGLATSAAGADGAASDCSVPDRAEELAKTSRKTEEGIWEYQSWIGSAAGDKVVDAIESQLARQFGTGTKSDPVARLAAGLIGIAPNHEAKRLVVLADPAKVDLSRLQAGLSSTANDASAKASTAEVPVEVKAACTSSDRLVEIYRTLQSRDWHPTARETNYGFGVDPYTSRIEVVIDPKADDAAEALTSRYPDGVMIQRGRIETVDNNRFQDDEPHWGAAAIGPAGWGNQCSSGFTVVTSGAGKAMVTAAHCSWENNDMDGNSAYLSGSQAYGSGQGIDDYPNYDMMLLDATGQNYNDDLYDNPRRAENSALDVVGGADPGQGSSPCISGWVELAVCGNDVLQLDWATCIPGESQCRYDLIRTRLSGAEDPCPGGTSGGPLYSTGSPTTIRGLVILAVYNEDEIIINCAHEKVSNVTSHLQVSVATS